MRNIKVLGVPFNFGQAHLGVSHAADALREAGFINRLEEIAPTYDLGNLDFSLLSKGPTSSPIKNLREVSLANELISQCIEKENFNNSFLLNVGGDHGMALGTIHGLLMNRPDRVVVWADAHGDINTPESSPSGNFHGMPLSFLLNISQKREVFPWLKRSLASQKLILFGPRDLDPEELKIIRDLSIQYYSSKTINNYGSEEILAYALKKADPFSKSAIHLSFDVDIFDAQDIHATGTRVVDGPRVSEVMNMGKYLGATGRLASMDMVEINPELTNVHHLQNTLNLSMKFALQTLQECFLQRAIFRPYQVERNLSA